MAINKDIIIPKRNITYEDVNEMLNDIREIGIENVEKILVIYNNPCPTNGDMIKSMFPRDYANIYDRSVSSWWNAPYEVEE